MTRFAAIALLGLLAAGYGRAPSAMAFSIELVDAAPMRIEQQRQEALGQLPLPGTPDLARRKERLELAGLKAGDPVFIRVFKSEAILELWMQKGDRFVLFASYPVCFWSGTLGPKLVEGDNQTPEGFYTVTRRQLHRSGRHPQSLNLGFPNAYDRANSRTGSYILVHGACSSIGCYAMTNPVAEEIFELTERALFRGQDRVHVHAFPFRMTDENLAAHADGPWSSFWQSMKPAYDAFEATQQVPVVGVCEKSYAVGAGRPEDEGDPGPLGLVGRERRRGQSTRIACTPVTPDAPIDALASGSIVGEEGGSVPFASRRRFTGSAIARSRGRLSRGEQRRAETLLEASEPGTLPRVFQPQ